MTLAHPVDPEGPIAHAFEKDNPNALISAPNGSKRLPGWSKMVGPRPPEQC